MTGPTRDFCTQQVRRLERLIGFKLERHLIEPLIAEIHTIAFSEDHAERMITHWLRCERFAPQIADVCDLADLVPPVKDYPPSCPKCRTSDWIFVERDHEQYVDRCDCYRGRLLVELSRYQERKREHRKLIRPREEWRWMFRVPKHYGPILRSSRSR